MDDLIDDDFGDLYADVEVQATSAINSAENFVKHSQADGDVGNNTKESKKENPVLESELLDSIEETLGDYSDADGSDSEDDLNIVLNDEDCQRFSVVPRRNGHVGGYGEGKAEAMAEEEEKDTGGGGAFCTGPSDPNGYYTQYPRNKMVRHHGSSFPSGIKGIESVVAASSYWRSSGGDMEDNSRRKLKVSNSGQVGDRSAASRGRYGFSLPWDRTILDVDIDAFEDKGWRYPGVDLTDFFNFGFNEDSWRQYCISLEQFRQQSSYKNSRIQTCESSKLFQANGIGSEHERSAQDSEADNITQAESSSNSADRGEVLLKLLKGRAIQVEDGTGEHQPSMDSRCPSYWDSDVVMQINVIDSVENGSCSVKDKLGYTESSGLEASKRRDITGDDSSCSVKDELGHTESIRLEVSKGRDITVDDLKDICYSEHASEDEVSIHSVEGNISCSQPVLESNKVHLDPEKVGDENDANQHCHQKVHAQASDNVSGAVETADKAEEKIVGDMCKSDPCLVETELAHGDRIHFGLSLSRSESYSDASTDSVYGSPIVYPSLIRRPSSYMELQDSLATDHKSPEKICARRNQGHRNNQGNKVPVGEGQKHQPGRHHRTAEWRIDRHDDEVFPVPRDKSPFSCNRQIGRMHDYHEGEHFSYSDQRDRFCGHHDYHQSFIDGIKLPNRRECSEEYFHKTSFRDDTQGVVDRDWHKRGRELPPEHMIPYTYREFRQLVSPSHSFKVRDMQWRSKTSNSQFQKRTNFDNCLCDPKNRKYLTIQEKCGRSSPFTKQRTDYVDKRGEHPSSFTGRELNPCGRRLRCNDGFPMNLENSRHVELEDDYWNLDHQHLPAQYCGVSDIPDEERWHGVKPPKSEMFESRFTERNGRYIRQIYHEECKGSGCVHGYSDDAYAEADIMHLGEVHFGRKYSCRLRVAHPSDDICAERNSYSHGKSSRHTRARAKYRSTAGWIGLNGLQLEECQCNMIGEESRTNFTHNNSNIMGGGDRELIRRCSDPKKLVVREAKFCERSTNDRSFVCNGKLKLKDLKPVEEQKVSKIFNESRRVLKTDFAELAGNRDDKKGVSFAEHNEDLDIEEGQIVTEEPNMKDGLESENMASVHNAKKRNFCPENAPIRSTHKKVYDNKRILETLAKMEKRRERFKDPIALKREPDKSAKSLADLIVVTDEAKQDRPARKRRWNGS